MAKKEIKVRSRTPRDIVPGFGALIRRVRKEQGLSQRALSRMAGVCAMSVSNIEAESRAPSLYVASKLASALGIRSMLAALADGVSETAPVAVTPSRRPRKLIVRKPRKP